MGLFARRGSDSNRRFAPRNAIACALIALTAVACAGTRETGTIHKSGFLVDYSMLKPGTGDEAQLVFVDPAVDFSKYDSILLENVSLWVPANPKEVKVSAEDRKRLSNLLYKSMHDSLAKDYKIVTEPGPKTLRVRAALTDAESANVVMDSVTSILPTTQVLGNLLATATDTAPWVGKAGGELDITDSTTGKRVAAAVDARVGLKGYSGLFEQWHDVDEAIKYWSERTRIRLAEERAKDSSKKKG